MGLPGFFLDQSHKKEVNFFVVPSIDYYIMKKRNFKIHESIFLILTFLPIPLNL